MVKPIGKQLTRGLVTGPCGIGDTLHGMRATSDFGNFHPPHAIRYISEGLLGQRSGSPQPVSRPALAMSLLRMQRLKEVSASLLKARCRPGCDPCDKR